MRRHLLQAIALATMVGGCGHGAWHKPWSGSASAYPWNVAVMLGGASHKCGGAHLGNGWVMTARHCVKGAAEVYVVAGQDDLTGKPYSRGSCRAEDNCVKAAPDGRDLALIWFKKGVAGLPAATIPDGGVPPGEGSEGFVLGWGDNLRLRPVALSVVALDNCHGLDNQGRSICATSKKALCRGDSGGGFVPGAVKPVSTPELRAMVVDSTGCGLLGWFRRLHGSHYAKFVDLHDPRLQSWIKCVIEGPPPPNQSGGDGGR